MVMDIFLFPSANGNLAVGNSSAALSVVDRTGTKQIKSLRQNFKTKKFDALFIRGLFYFVFGIFCLLCGLFWSTKFNETVGKKTSVDKVSEKLMLKTATIIFTVLGLFSFVASAFLLGVLPDRLVNWVVPELSGTYLYKLFVGLLKIPIFLLMLFSLKFIPAITEFYRFNAVCKKGVNFLNFVMFSFILTFFVLSLVAIDINVYADPFIKLFIFIVCVSLSYELLFHLPWLKFATLYFVTAPATVTQEETAESALEEVGLIEKQQDRKLIDTKADGSLAFSAVYTEVKNRLKKQDVPESDADWIFATVFSKGRAEVKLTESVSQKQYKEIIRMTARREKGEPLSSIFGHVDFYGLKIAVNKNVLTPRQETELLAEEVIKLVKNIKKPEVLDLCTGSGAIAIAIKKNTEAKVFASDVSKLALENAKQNAEANGVKIEFFVSDMFKGLKKKRKFDIIVSNPPYLTETDMQKLSPEVRGYDPKLALYGGEDGLDFYRRIATEALNHLEKHGSLLLEVGKGQAKKVAKLLKENGFTNIKILKDYSKIERIIVATKLDV